MQKESGVLEQYVSEISKAVKSFPEQETGAKRSLDRLSMEDPVLFFAAGINVVAGVQPCDGTRYLVLLLAKDKRLSNWLLDPNACTLKAATAVALTAAEARVHVQSTLEMALNKALQQQASPPNTNRILRILSLIEAIGSQSHWNSFQVELMAYPDKVVRSKAALLIGRTERNTEWILRRLLDRDPRVQANAVETLWELGDAAKPHLREALKSKHGRVFANAALGLYRIGDSSTIQVLLEAMRHEEVAIRISALWAIGQTRDPRFLPALSQQFKSATGKVRLAVAGAMSRIRQREKSSDEKLRLQITVAEAALDAAGERRIVFSVASRPAHDFNGLKATEFFVSENGAPVDVYEVRTATGSDLLVAGFVAPWSESADELLEPGFREGLSRCLAMKRKDDVWRIDRYAATPQTRADASTDAAASETKPAGTKPSDRGTLPYDEAVITPQIAAANGWVAEIDQLRKIAAVAGPRTRAATSGLAAMERQCKAIHQRNGRRHIFIVLDEAAAGELQQESAAAQMRALTQEHGAIFHGIAVGAVASWLSLKDVCTSNPEGTFAATDPAGVAEELASSYAALRNKFEIRYVLPASPGVVKLGIASGRGSGEAEVTLEDAPSETAAPAVPEASPA
jgi:hypothetical protein